MSDKQTTTSPLCGTHCADPLWCIQRKMCKRDGAVDFQAERSETTRSIITIELVLEADGRWIADIPDLPGCLVYGSTREYAKASVLALAARILSDMEYHNEPK